MLSNDNCQPINLILQCAQIEILEKDKSQNCKKSDFEVLWKSHYIISLCWQYEIH